MFLHNSKIYIFPETRPNHVANESNEYVGQERKAESQ